MTQRLDHEISLSRLAMWLGRRPQLQEVVCLCTGQMLPHADGLFSDAK